MIHASTFHTNTTGYDRTAGKNKCTGTADHTPSQLAPNPIKARCDSCQLAYRPIIKYVVCTKKCSSIKAMTRRSLTNSSKSKPLGFHSQHDPTTLAQASIHHSYLAHVLVSLIYSSIFRQTPYNSRVMVTLPYLDFYRKLSMAKQIKSISLNKHTLPSMSDSRARRENMPKGFYSHHMN